MDCRRPLSLALTILAASAGCSQNSTTVRSGTTPATVTANAKTDTLDPEALKRQPKPETFVAFGDFSALEADSATAPAEVEQLRDRARKAYQEALKIDPSNVPALKSLGGLYASSNDCGRAKEIYETALKVAPDDASIWFTLGMTYARTKEWPQAIEHLAKATELDPENRSYRRHLGFALARAGRTDESLAMFVRYEGEAKAHYYLAQMLDHLGQTENCKMHLQLALAQDPKLTDAAQMLVRVTGGVAAQPAAPALTATLMQNGAPPIQPVSYTEAAHPANDPAIHFPPPPPPMSTWSDSVGGEGK
jgi:tetratricopeptide (TPR) repeat protein